MKRLGPLLAQDFLIESFYRLTEGQAAPAAALAALRARGVSNSSDGPTCLKEKKP